MTGAKVIPLPFLQERRQLQERIEDMRREAEHAEQLWRDLNDGTRHYSEWNPGLEGCLGYPPQQIAADEAFVAWHDTLARLHQLETLAEKIDRAGVSA